MQSRKKKMCVVTTVAFTLEVFLLQQLVYLAKNGFEITIVCNHDEELERNCPKELHYWPIAMDRTTSIWSTLKGMAHFYFFLKKNEFELIQYCTPKAGFIAAVSSWLAGVPVRLYCQWGMRYVSLHGIKRSLVKWVEKAICLLSTHISPDSFGNREFAIREKLYNEEKSSVVYRGSANGVDLQRFDYVKRDQWRSELYQELGIIEPQIVYGWIGRVTKDKGVNELVQAFKKICIAYENIQLIMVGPMEDNNGLLPEVKNAIIVDSNIYYVGRQTEVPKYYAAMDVLVVPSYREGFGSFAIEAQAMGVPVISTDIPGPREAIVAGKTGILVPVKNVTELVAAMELLRDDIVMRQAMGKQGRSYVEEFYDQRIFWEKVLEHRLMLLKEAEERDVTGVKSHL